MEEERDSAKERKEERRRKMRVRIVNAWKQRNRSKWRKRNIGQQRRETV